MKRCSIFVLLLFLFLVWQRSVMCWLMASLSLQDLLLGLSFRAISGLFLAYLGSFLSLLVHMLFIFLPYLVSFSLPASTAGESWESYCSFSFYSLFNFCFCLFLFFFLLSLFSSLVVLFFAASPPYFVLWLRFVCHVLFNQRGTRVGISPQMSMTTAVGRVILSLG